MKSECAHPPNHTLLKDVFPVFLPPVDHETNWEFKIMGCLFGIISIPAQGVYRQLFNMFVPISMKTATQSVFGIRLTVGTIEIIH